MDHIIHRTPIHDQIFGYTTMLPAWTYELFLEHVLPQDRAEVDRIFRAATTSRVDWSLECRIRRVDGEVRWIWAAGGQAKDLGGVSLRMSGIVQDITARKRAEVEREQLEAHLRQAQKMEAIGTLAGGIAHDFNNILSVIYGYTALARLSAGGNTQLLDYLNEIGRAGNRAAELVQQILSFSRSREQAMAPVQLRPIVTEAAKLLRATLPRTIELTLQLAEDLPAILGNNVQLHQILLNLGTNAAHAMRDLPGRLTIQLSTCTTEEVRASQLTNFTPVPCVRLKVSDTGRGMDAATQERVFEPFFTTKGPGEGTGLGLAVVHGIVHGHHGTIRLTSEIDHGTTFEIFLPVVADETATVAVVPASLPRGQGERILLVDDEETIVRAWEQMLRKLGYAAESECLVLDALARFERDPQAFDLVVTDQTMPDLTGLEFARRIHALRADLPVVLTTGYVTTLTPERIREAGVCEVLEKPYTIDLLVAAIRRHPPARPAPAPSPVSA